MSIDKVKLTAINYTIYDKMYSIMDNDFSEWLLQELKTRNWSQSELAKKAGLHRQVISTYIGGQRQKPDYEILLAIARALKIPPETIFRAVGWLPESKEITPDQERLLYLFNNLTPKNQQYALKLLAALGEED